MEIGVSDVIDEDREQIDFLDREKRISYERE